ncbi:MAG: hypothetical protein DRR08_23665 [Candidatus Parabeggiatoa sp. nov. 2]|nr:MAG: hypothetical protein DRR08_23665 [Gammaproteobacteria bacterium]
MMKIIHRFILLLVMVLAAQPVYAYRGPSEEALILLLGGVCPVGPTWDYLFRFNHHLNRLFDTASFNAGKTEIWKGGRNSFLYFDVSSSPVWLWDVNCL